MAVLGILLVAACVFDYFTRRIPNWIIFLICFVGLFFGFREQRIAGMLAYSGKMVFTMAVYYPLFMIGVLGAGDVKLIGVVAGSLPHEKILFFSFYFMLIAAIFSLIKVLKQKNLMKRAKILLCYLRAVITGGSLLPYPAEASLSMEGRICLSGPVLFAWLLYLGGIY